MPQIQKQHKIPRVYLKKFGYQDSNNHWRISVMKVGQKGTSQEFIKSFTSIPNHFDIPSENDLISKIFENDFNKKLEDNYNQILDVVEKDEGLTIKTKAYLCNLIPNFLVRSESLRNEVIEILESNSRELFLRMLIEASKLQSNPNNIEYDYEKMYKSYVIIKTEDLINRAIILLSGIIYLKFLKFSFIILKSPPERKWWTSDNPVIANLQQEGLDLMTNESDFYLPLSPQYLLYCYNDNSRDKSGKLRALQKDLIHQADVRIFDSLLKQIMLNADNNIIIAGHYEKKYSA